ncbi:glycosyl hydrolase family 18 protein [Jonesia denitrificans]|uniref:chitinase n=2 Tax=Jonesia TaxID=43673 RepID=C7R4I0_JONDD|nr:glycosyl hydrolase family 18 protein [Jonesia denitrificans]ACV09037.1 Chitinase [Jonesia denitrificans DSM 20603]QXB44210.1 lytic polysaccharide monooxygenase [Jonesia denitrificans]SQH21170.1 Chitinase 63 precursor [Jonesia denitrificans]
MKKRKLRASAAIAVLLGAGLVPALSATPAAAHGWVTDPPSRQALCASGETSFDCGQISYEPQSVEAPKGATTCSGGNEAFAILDDNSKPWPTTEIASTVDLTWKLTAPHNTSTWEYFVDGQLHQTFDQKGQQPPTSLTHTLTDLPTGEHTILARWNVSNTNNAFYNCMDVVVSNNGGNTGGDDSDPGDGNTDSDTPATPQCPPAYSPSAVYTQGNQVTHEGHIWKAKWWTQGQAPGTTGQWGQWEDLGPCSTDPGDGDGDGDPGDGNPGEGGTPPPDTPGTGDERIVGYFTNWGVYGRDYHVKNIKTSGAADHLTHIMYAFGNVQGGKCTIGDAYADYDKAYTAAQSVDGVADTWDQPLRGNFNQLRKLKAEYPHIKVVWSFGGWTWSGGFGQAAQNPEAFAQSCRDLVEDPRWADVFDGIDIDWEYPNACGATCDTSGRDAYRDLLAALRTEFGDDLVTSAIPADATDGGKIDAANYAGGAEYLDWIMPMSYDYFGAWDKNGPTAPHSPLTSYQGIPIQGYDTTSTINKLTGLGIPADKILLGIGFYGRGWTGVTDPTPGSSATGAAPGTYEAGIEDYKVLAQRCPATGQVAGTSYGFCDGQWWSYDTPQDIIHKMNYANTENLGGAFFWELSGDTADGDLITAIATGLQ